VAFVSVEAAGLYPLVTLKGALLDEDELCVTQRFFHFWLEIKTH
jgi:hypothetical protein